MKKFMALGLLSLCLSCSGPNYTQTRSTNDQPKPCAVVDLDMTVIAPHNYAMPGRDMSTEDFRTPITEAIEAAFLRSGKYVLVERARLDSIKRELVTSLDDVWFDQDTTVKIGGFHGAHFLLLPTARLEVGIFRTTLSIQVKLTDVQTGKILRTFRASSSSMSPNTNNSISKCLADISDQLTKQLS